MDYYKQFKKHIENNDLPSFLSLWEEYCMGDEVDPKELKKILTQVKDTELAPPFGRHVESALPLWEKIGDKEESLAILKLIFDLQTSNSKHLASLATKFLESHYKETKYFNEKIRLVGLRECLNFQGAITNFVLLDHFKVGNFVYHTGGWGVGEIMEVSFVREQIGVEFDYVPGQKDLSFQNAFKTVIPITHDHFLARRFGNPDALEELAKKDPCSVIRMMLKDMGPLTAAEIKDELCELVIPEEDWSKWWQNTRNKIKKDTFVHVPDSQRKPFKIREKELTHEEQLMMALEQKPNPEKFISLIYSFIRDFPQTLKDTAFRAELKERFLKKLSDAELTDAQELQIHFFLQDIEPEEEMNSIEEFIKRIPSPKDLVHKIEIIAFKKRVLSEMRKVREDWADVFKNLLLEVDQTPLRDYLLQELLKDKKTSEVNEKLEELIAHPTRSPGAFLWYINKIMGNSNLPFANKEGKNRFFDSFLILLNKLEQETNARDLVKKMLAFLSNGRYANVRKIFQQADQSTVQEFLLLASKCMSLTEHDLKILHSLAEVVHPKLKKLRKEVVEEEDLTIWALEEGYHRIKDRIKEIATVETVENAKEIEKARELGDLRENAEFKSALEKRDRLQSELKFLTEQFNHARILTPDDISSDVVGIGNVVECVDEQNQTILITILGPWEAEPEKNILSFQSKIAQNITGKKVGEKINYQDKEYTIKSIKSYFDVVNAK